MLLDSTDLGLFSLSPMITTSEFASYEVRAERRVGGGRARSEMLLCSYHGGKYTFLRWLGLNTGNWGTLFYSNAQAIAAYKVSALGARQLFAVLSVSKRLTRRRAPQQYIFVCTLAPHHELDDRI